MDLGLKPPPPPNPADDVMLPLRLNGTMKPPPPPNAAEKTFPLRTKAATAASVKGLQASVDLALDELKSWSAPIPFVVRHPSSYSPEVLHENILEFLLPKYTNQRIYFRLKYNHTQLQFCGDGNQGWRELLSDLSSSALQNSGLHLLSNGGSKDRINVRKNSC
jgi:hypothetical protein